MMLRACLATALALLPLLSAQAQVTQDDLAGVGIADRRGAALPDVSLDGVDTGQYRLHDVLSGRPALLMLVDYTCATLCGVTLNALSQALESVPLTIARDYGVLVIGLDAKDGTAQVESFRKAHFAQSPPASGFAFLRGSREAVDEIADSVGFVSEYDPARGQFAHPAAVIVVTPEGRISRSLNPLALTPLDLRLALTEAGQGRIGSVADQVFLLCYGWDAATGIYTLQIRRMLMISGAATVLLLLGAIAAFRYREWLAGRRETP